MDESHSADASDRTGIRLDQTAAVLAAVPHLIGLYPVNSVVVIGLHGEVSDRVGLTVRADIPDACCYDLLPVQLLRTFVPQDARNAILVVIDGSRESEHDDLPYRALVDTFVTVC